MSETRNQRREVYERSLEDSPSAMVGLLPDVINRKVTEDYTSHAIGVLRMPESVTDRLSFFSEV